MKNIEWQNFHRPSNRRPRLVGQRKTMYCGGCHTTVIHEGDRLQFSKKYRCLGCGKFKDIFSKHRKNIGPKDFNLIMVNQTIIKV